MDAIVPPGNTQLLTSDHKDHHHRERCATSEQVSIEAMGTRQLVSAEAAEERSVTGQFGFQNLNASAGAGAETRADIDRVGHALNDQVSQFGIAGLNATNSQSEATRGAVFSSSNKDREATSFYGFHNNNSIKDGVKDILLQNACDTASIKAQEACDFKDILLQAANNASAALVDSTKNAAAAALAAAVNAADIRLELCKSTNALQLQAAQDKAHIEAKIAECCCENRLLVTEKASQTDALIRKLDEDRYKDELQKTRDALIALQFRATVPPAPVAAVGVGVLP